MVVEKMITRATKAAPHPAGDARGVHARREVGRLIKDRSVIGELFDDPGGYTRIVKLGQRPGDGAEMAVIELVDFNTGQDESAKPTEPAKVKKEQQPRKKSKSTDETQPTTAKEKKKAKDAPVKKKGSSAESAKKESQ